MILTSKQLAEAMGVTVQAVTQRWVKDQGLPVHSRGCDDNATTLNFDLKEFALWYVRYQTKDDNLGAVK